MQTKIQKKFLDMGFGFPVLLINVPMLKIHGVWTPHINYNHLTSKVLYSLAYKESFLSGNELKFIRLHFELTLQEFAKRFCVAKTAVIKWEKSADHPTFMNWLIEKDIRLFILTKLDSKSKELAKLYNELTQIPSEVPLMPIHLQIKKIAA